MYYEEDGANDRAYTRSDATEFDSWCCRGAIYGRYQQTLDNNDRCRDNVTSRRPLSRGWLAVV